MRTTATSTREAGMRRRDRDAVPMKHRPELLPIRMDRLEARLRDLEGRPRLVHAAKPDEILVFEFPEGANEEQCGLVARQFRDLGIRCVFVQSMKLIGVQRDEHGPSEAENLPGGAGSGRLDRTEPRPHERRVGWTSSRA